MSNKIIHKHSSVVTDGNPKIPTSSQLAYGELAINYADGVETISFKNSNNEIVEIKTKNYFDNQIVSNSKKIQALEDSYDLIASEIENNELVTASAITNLEERTTNVENGLTEKSDVGHTHTSENISDSISAKSGITSTATGLVQGKAVYDYASPKSHASSSTTYGVATTANYGHVKISNGDVATVANANGLAAGMDHSHSNYSTTGHTHDFYNINGIINSEMNGTLNIVQTGMTLVSSVVIIPIGINPQYSLGYTIKVNFSNPNNLIGYVNINSFQNSSEISAPAYNLDNIYTINTNGTIVLMYIGNNTFRVIYNDYDNSCDTYTDYAKKILEYNYCTCETASGTSSKTASISGFILSTGVLVLVDFTNNNTTSTPTLNINNTGAKYIRKFSASESVGAFERGVYALVYDGTQYQMLNCYNSSRAMNLYTAPNSEDINFRIPFMHKGSDATGTNAVCTQQSTSFPLMFNPSSGLLTVKTTSSSSDERLKNFKNDIDIDFNKLKQIPKKYFTWKYDDKEIINIGTSAQEVEKIYPELVHEYESENNEQYKSIEYQTLSVIALAAIDKLHERIEYLENKIKEYETK